MGNLSLRWRITLLMGLLVLSASILLTLLTIHNMTDSFVTPLTNISNISNNADSLVPFDEEKITFSGDTADFPDGVQYVPEINLSVETARKSFSVFSLFYLAIVVVVSMIAAYYLAGRAMRPISKLNDQIETMDGKSLSKRLDNPQTKDEIENLTLSFNKLFERLERDFERERRFSSNAAHELKTPLTTIQTSAQVLKLSDTPEIEEYRENLDITLQSVKRLSHVLDGLLLLGQPNVEVTFEALNLCETLHRIKKELEPCYREKNITLTYDLQSGTLTGNPLLLYRVFFNLIENAYKYTNNGGTITINTYNEGMETIVCISDTGIGIPEEDIPHIFEPFYRADKSRSRKIAGAGLGLSIAKDILDLHKARISVTSHKEGGTVVEVRFQKYKLYTQF